MNKSDVVRAVATKTRTSAKDTEEMLDAILEVLSLALVCDENVLLSGFGKFEVRTRKPGMRRNPHTGGPVEVGERKSCGFKPALNLRKRMNGDAQ